MHMHQGGRKNKKEKHEGKKSAISVNSLSRVLCYVFASTQALNICDHTYIGI